MATQQQQRKADSKRKGKRTRAWACVLYPESAPDGWLDKLRETHLEILISPLHDQDVNADGSPKKPHWHVLAMWPSPASEHQASELFGCIGVTAPPEMVRSVKGYARYLIHLDDHDKHRYDAEDVQALGGASWAAVAADEADELERLLDEIEDWIDEQGVVSYRTLMRYARNERPDWKRTIRSHTIHIKAYLRSAEWESRQDSAC